MKHKKKQIIIISCVLLALILSLGVAVWFIVKPENKQVDEPNIEAGVDVDWYSINQKEFTITTAEQLFELAQLSAKYDFSGQTIKLGADIVVNEGDANKWGIEFPEKIWDHPIDGFAGTFDGQGHTISGIYGIGFLYKVDALRLTPLPAGLFSNTKADCVIKNFRLVNSYFCGDLQDGAGVISACGGGTFDSIYSDAILVSYKYWNGGIIGKATESTTITNCWFDGKIDIDGGYARYTGGIMGRAMNPEADFRIEHCLVTATMENDTKKTGVGMGAILGNALESSNVIINDCFVDAKLTNEWGVAVGSVYGVSEKNATVNLTNTYATTESYDKMVGAVLGVANGMPVGYQKEFLKGYGGYQWTSLDFEKYWSVVENGTPILTTFAEKSPSLEGVERYVDISWYKDDVDKYVLYDKADLYGFSLLSQSWDFKDKTVKLGADIVINKGKASNWGKEAPLLEWISIGPKSKPFAGTFDGQMHTISGIYLDSDVMNTGLFSVTADTSKIKNLKLKNSYIESEASFTGSIVGQGRGTIDTVYSDAIVVSSKGSVGGFIGLGYGKKVSVKNCWFAGNVKNVSNNSVERGTGGLIGTIYDDASAKIVNCLNTGIVDASSYKFNQAKTGKNITPIVGGLVGWVRKASSTLDVQSCLNTGKVLVSDVATGGYGSILGYTDGNVTIAHTYATTESSKLTAAKIDGWVLALEKAQLTGYEGYRWTTLDFNKYWSVVKKDTPALKSFVGKGESISKDDRMVDTSWYDSKKDTYVLMNVADLYGFSYLSNGTDFAKKTIKLGADIDVNNGKASEWATKRPSNAWRPISSKNLPFAGTFDGGMHTISGIFVDADTRNNGFFAATGETSVVKNLKLTNSYFTSTAGELGSIAGQGRGTFETVYSDAVVVGNSSNIGGLVGMGYGQKVVMDKCWFDGIVKNTANHMNSRGTGGLIGTLYDGSHAEIKGCLNSGTVDVTAYKYDQKPSAEETLIAPIAAGLVGWVKTDKSSVNIENCLNTKAVLVDASVTGGYGAIIGLTENKKETKVVTTYTTVEPTTQSSVTGKIFLVNEDDIKGYDAHQWTLLDFNKYWAVVENKTPIVKTLADKVPSLSGVDKMVDISWLDNAKGTESDPYIISDRADLYGVSMLAAEKEYNGFAGKYFKLVRDITINTGDANDWDEKAPKYQWKPIGSKSLLFAGKFDGDMHTISGVYINTNVSNSGLFGATGETSVIKNLKLKNSYIKSTASDVGSIAGQGRGEFNTIYSEAIVEGANTRIGGLIGMGYGKKVIMKECWFAGVVTNKANHRNYRGTGGLMGVLYDNGTARIENSLNSGVVDVTAYTYNQDSETSPNVTPIVGGLVGWSKTKGSTLTIVKCVNTGSVLYSSKATGGYHLYVGLKDKAPTITDTYYDNTVPPTAIGDTAKTKMPNLGWDKEWSTVPYAHPVLKKFLGEVIDTSWYDEPKNGTTYILKDRADLYGLAVLSQTNNFAGKTIELGDDIQVNVGDEKDWSKGAPSFKWYPIGKDKAFAGEFDGKMHTISGVYYKTTAANAGLFGYVNSKSTEPTIRNLKLVNSYISSTNMRTGGLVGRVDAATFNTVYCDAYVQSSAKWVGGFIGMAYNATITMDNCQFAGTVINTGNAKGIQGTGGFIGDANAACKITMNHCLNTGVVDATAYKYVNNGNIVPCAGGFIGYAEGNANASINIKNCLVTKEVLVDQSANIGYGPAIGYRSGGAARITNVTYVMAKTYDSAISQLTANLTNFRRESSENALKGKSVVEDFGFEANTLWMTAPNAAPCLKSFEDID